MAHRGSGVKTGRTHSTPGPFGCTHAAEATASPMESSMIRAVVRWSLTRPRLVVAMAAVLMVYGGVVLNRARFDVFPDFVPPQVEVQTEAPGLSAEQVETLVSRPLEQAIAGGTGIESVRSTSLQGVSVMIVRFDDGVDPFRARQTVTDSLVQASGSLPTVAGAPRVSPLTSSTMDLLKIGFTSDRLSPDDLRDRIDRVVRPRLLAAPGVARASIYGGSVKRIEVRFRPQDMARFGLSPSDLASAATQATGVEPGGFIDTPAQRILISPQGQAKGPADIAAAVIKAPNGATVRISDVADVIEALEPQIGDTLIMGRPGVLLSLSSQYGANTLDATRAVDAALAELKPTLDADGIAFDADLHRPANFISTALHGLRDDILIGALLIAAILYAFMRGARPVLISFVSIPLSLLAALIVLDALGHTLDTMILGGMAVALGVVVDDAVIDVENIARRLRLNPRGEPTEIVEAASLEVRGPVVYATVVVALSLAPVLFLTGLQGRFFAPLAAGFILATFASLVVAVVVTPALALLTLPARPLRPEPRWLEELKRRLGERLRPLMARPVLCLGLIGGALAILGLALPFVGAELLPSFREGHFVVQVAAQPGTSLESTRALGADLSRRFLDISGVKSVEQQLGRAQGSEDPWGPERSEFHVELDHGLSGRAQDRVEAALEEVLSSRPGLETEVLTFLGDRIGESVTGETAPVSIEVSGENLDDLDVAAKQVERGITDIPGVGEVTMRTPPNAPAIRISPYVDRLADHGLSVNDVMDAVSSAFNGSVAAQLYRPDRAEDVTVILSPEARADPLAIGALTLNSAVGGEVPLSSVAEVAMADQRTVVARQDGRRRIAVTASPTPDQVARVAREAEARVRALTLPAGVVAAVVSTADAADAARRQLLLNVILAALAAVGVLLLALGDGRSIALVLSAAPPAFLGGLLFLPLAGGVLSLGALVGFVTLFGVAARNGILMVAHVRHLVEREDRPWSTDTVIQATLERASPILMTASVTGLGLLPLALQTGESGREIQGPMAIVILGGLVTSTLATLFLLPPMILRFGAKGRPQREPKDSR